MILVRLTLILTCLSLLFLAPKFSAANQFGLALADAAEQQVGVTVTYDPSYVSIPFPGGDIPRDKGVCSDVFIRALRDAHQIDLQQRVNTDMKKAFSRYPKTWGLKSTDTSIDHRRVYNLQRFLERQGFSLPVSSDANDYLQVILSHGCCLVTCLIWVWFPTKSPSGAIDIWLSIILELVHK